MNCFLKHPFIYFKGYFEISLNNKHQSLDLLFQIFNVFPFHDIFFEYLLNKLSGARADSNVLVWSVVGCWLVNNSIDYVHSLKNIQICNNWKHAFRIKNKNKKETKFSHMSNLLLQLCRTQHACCPTKKFFWR